MLENGIDWKLVNEKLRCPKCGDKAYIAAETDGTEGFHTHRFPISRKEALRLSLPDKEEIEARIRILQSEINQLNEVKNRL